MEKLPKLIYPFELNGDDCTMRTRRTPELLPSPESRAGNARWRQRQSCELPVKHRVNNWAETITNYRGPVYTGTANYRTKWAGNKMMTQSIYIFGDAGSRNRWEKCFCAHRERFLFLVSGSGHSKWPLHTLLARKLTRKLEFFLRVSSGFFIWQTQHQRTKKNSNMHKKSARRHERNLRFWGVDFGCCLFGTSCFHFLFVAKPKEHLVCFSTFFLRKKQIFCHMYTDVPWRTFNVFECQLFGKARILENAIFTGCSVVRKRRESGWKLFRLRGRQPCSGGKEKKETFNSRQT